MKTVDLELALKPYELHLRGLLALNDDDNKTLAQPISKLGEKIIWPLYWLATLARHFGPSLLLRLSIPMICPTHSTDRVCELLYN